ncbi:MULTISPECIES: VOC family protein [Paenibacillus]|uniref:Glyoxalase n=1 Tax=Paenibacillus albilobatus TaxID=2716884 RepID=A0A919XQE1_9BACL|nr:MULTISPECIES: VOC family protein [Paenibacillus]MDR9856996.1 VOC family protein [Paenibacillus sp. VCA1]GIO34308.1 glyoxalase [Paenibacillus albilobatus]
MKINHLNLTVTDVAASQAFLETYFGLKCQASRGDNFAVLFDDDGFVLTLMKGREVEYPKTFHIGFPQSNEEQVNRMYQRLFEDGYDVKPPQHSHAYTFYVKAPGGFMVEILC